MKPKKFPSNFSDVRDHRKKRQLYLYSISGFLAAYFLFFGIFSFFLRVPFFRVTRVEVVGAESISSGDALAALQATALKGSLIKSLFGFGNILAWPTGANAHALALLPAVKSLEVRKDYFTRTITLDVTERNPYGIWCFEESRGPLSPSCFWFDDGGTIFRRAMGVEGGAIPVIDDASERETGLNAQVLPKALLPNFLSVLQLLDKSGIRGARVHLKDLGLEEVTVTEPVGPALLFSLKFPAANLGTFLVSFLNRPGYKNFQYVDFRVENRVYYK